MNIAIRITLAFILILGGLIVYLLPDEPVTVVPVTLSSLTIQVPTIEFKPKPKPAKVVVKKVEPNFLVIITASNEKIKHNSLDVFCMAKNIYHEARSENMLGQLAVAQVTLNRLKSKRYPNTICKVVLQRKQFSWANKRSLRWTHPRGTAWTDAKHIAKQVITGGVRVSGLDNALFYHTTAIKPRWMKPEAKVATIGTHIFYTGANKL